jgi:ribosome biogenesis GTPase
VHRQLVARAAGGLIIDTPGMRELQLWDPAPVADAFEDIAALAPSCRFRDCRHDREPGCAVKAAVDAGMLESRRYAHYLKLQEEGELARRAQTTYESAPRTQDSTRPSAGSPGRGRRPRQ